MNELLILQKKLAREQKARKKAESTLEKKTIKLIEANKELRLLNDNLEKEIAKGTTALRKNERRYRQIIETASDLIYRTDYQGIITYVNQVAYNHFGYEKGEVEGKPFFDFVRPDFQEVVINFYKYILSRKQERSYFEFPILSKMGKTFWIGQNVQLIIEEGRVMEVTAVARDISDRKETEDALLTTQTRLTALISNLQAGVLVEDESGKIVLANQHFCDLFNVPISPQWLVGNERDHAFKKFKKLVVYSEKYDQSVEQLLENRKPVVGEEWHLRNGAILERDYIPIFVDKKYFGHLWKFRDVTKQRRAEAKLRRSEEKYRGIIENMELGLMEVDLNHKIIKAYDLFCEMTGYKPHELEGKIATEIFLPTEFSEVMKSQDDKRVQGQPSVYEVQMRKKDGSLMWALISGAPIFDENGKATGSIAIHYDITERKQLEQDLEDAKQEAEAAQKAEQQFLAKMSHEIRTPLNAIIGMSHLLYDTQPTEQQKEYLTILKSSSDILQSLISDILDLSKVQAGEVEINPKEFDLTGLIISLQKTFQLKLENQPIEVEAEIDPGIKNLLLGDDLLLNQILINLLGNASKFTKKGFIGIRANLAESKGKDRLVKFTVYDTGIGIATDRLQAIFENFKQADREVRHKYGGTGLGLAITKQLIELQGGKIEVESEIGQGTSFSFSLKYQDTGRQMEEIAEELPAETNVEISSYKILIAEDNYMNRKYISTLLKKWDVSYHMAHNGREALHAAQKEKFDLIFMDISMPEMNGYEATIAIRNTANYNQQTPIVALTASALRSKKDKALKSGMTDYLPKPFKPIQLLNLIQNYVAKANTLEREAGNDTNGFSFNSKLDVAHLNDIYCGDLEYASEIFDTFLNHSSKELKDLKPLIESEDWMNTSKLAHKLKPTFSMVGLTRLEDKLQLIETLSIKKPEREILLALCEQVEDTFVEYSPLLEKELEGMRSCLVAS